MRWELSRVLHVRLLMLQDSTAAYNCQAIVKLVFPCVQCIVSGLILRVQ
jgi:hypothetical protein